jgi:plasmid stabilization system protein ParE
VAKRAVKWSRTADLQYLSILEYWVNRNKSATYSKKLFRSVSAKTKAIAENPNQFKISDYEDVRIAILGDYSIYFRPLPNEIIILAFWDNRQDPKKLLEIISKSR